MTSHDSDCICHPCRLRRAQRYIDSGRRSYLRGLADAVCDIFRVARHAVVGESR